MSSVEEKELRAQLRTNGLARRKVNNQIGEIKSERLRLKDERANLHKQAEKLGIRVGNKKAAI